MFLLLEKVIERRIPVIFELSKRRENTQTHFHTAPSHNFVK